MNNRKSIREIGTHISVANTYKHIYIGKEKPQSR